MSQYQAYAKPVSEMPTPPRAQSPPPTYAQPDSYHQPQSLSAHQQSQFHPQQSTFPPQYQQHASPTMTNMQQPNMAYQPQHPMSEKHQPHAAVQDHGHGLSHSHGSKFGSKWLFGMFDCCSPFSTCLLGSCCPCMLFGKTYAREQGDGETSGCGLMCCAWYCAGSMGFNSCLQAIIRGQQRERHGIEGNGFSDCCSSFWCGCCTLIQEEKESVVRITGMDPKTKVAYQPLNQGMHYPSV